MPDSDLCIAGGGAAGIKSLDLLRNAPLSIVLLEGGYEAFDWRTQQLSRFEQAGRPIRSPDYSRPFRLDQARLSESRLRQYGGTTNIWSGRWKTLTPFDVSPKPFLRATSWPIRYEELRTYYDTVAADYGVEQLYSY